MVVYFERWQKIQEVEPSSRKQVTEVVPLEVIPVTTYNGENIAPLAYGAGKVGYPNIEE